MAPISSVVIFATSVGIASGYVAPSSFIGSSSSKRLDTKVYENFGLDFAEDQGANTLPIILGEERYKQWAGSVNKDSLVNRQYNALQRVRELDLLGKTVETGLLSKLEKNGIDLETLESLLPTLEKLGALSLVANNQQLLINLVAPLVVEGGPLLLPPLAAALEVGPPAFFLAAAVFASGEYLLIANQVQIPLVGLPADVFLGLLLVPLTIVFGGLGVALSSAKK